MRLRELRKNANLTMKEFGKIFNLTESTISLYETGKHEPEYNTLKKFANYFNVTTDYLLGAEINEKTAEDKTTTEKKQLFNNLVKAGLTLENYNKMTEQQREDLLNVIKIFVNNSK